MEPPPCNQRVGEVLGQTFAAMQVAVAAEMANVDRREVVFHCDVWTDQWSRHFVAGIAEWLCPKHGQRECRLVCFEMLEKWTDRTEHATLEMAQTVATALRAAWRRLELGEEPMYYSPTMPRRPWPSPKLWGWQASVVDAI